MRAVHVLLFYILSHKTAPKRELLTQVNVSDFQVLA